MTAETPLTDAEMFQSRFDQSEFVVDADLARRLERDRAELIEALRTFTDAIASRDHEPLMNAAVTAMALLHRLEKP